MGSGYGAFPGGGKGGKPEFDLQDIAEGKPSGAVQPGNKVEAYASGASARATASSGGSTDYVVRSEYREPPIGASSPSSGIDEIIASYREAAVAGGYSSEAFDHSDIIASTDSDTKNISDVFDEVSLPTSVDFATFTNPLLDLGIDPSIPTIISAFTYFAPTRHWFPYGSSTESTSTLDFEEFDIANDSIANFLKSAKNYYIVNAGDIDRVEQFIQGSLTTKYEPWISGWTVAGGVSSNFEGKSSLQMDMFLAQYDPAYAEAVGATWASEGYNAFDRSMYSIEYDQPFTVGGANNIEEGSSINLPLTHINYIQPYIAKELFLSAKSWVEVKKLIEDAARIPSGAEPYFGQHHIDMNAESYSRLGPICSSYRWASLNKIVPHRGYHHYTDMSDISDNYINSMKNRFRSEGVWSNPIKEIYEQVLCFKDNMIEQQTPTKLYSQIAFDLYKTVKDGSWYFTQHSPGARTREHFSESKLQPEKGYWRDKSSNLITSMQSISGASVSDDEIGDFIESMPGTSSQSISAIFGLLGRDYIQNIAMNNSVFTKEALIALWVHFLIHQRLVTKCQQMTRHR